MLVSSLDQCVELTAGERCADGFVRLVLGYLPKDYEGVIQALKEGKLKPTKMITGKIAIDRVVEDGYTP